MTADEALQKVQEFVQDCRMKGECDLRSIIWEIKALRKEIADQESEKTKVQALDKPPVI